MKDQQSPSKRHERTSRAARCSQAACWCLASCCLRRGIRTGRVRRFPEKALVPEPMRWLGSTRGMLALSGEKGRLPVRLSLVPHRKDDTHPDVGQGANRHAMALPFLSFAVVVVLGPRFLLRARLRKLVQRIAQRLDAGKVLMHSSVVSALEGDRRGSGQRLNTFCSGIAMAIISPFDEHARRQADEGTGRLLKTSLSSCVTKS
jgi:hypothetical protein